MSESNTPFDHRQDPRLGAALRAALTPPDEAGFVARVVAAAVHGGAWTRGGGAGRGLHPVEHLLERWARRGIAVAAVAALIAGFIIGRSRQSSAPSVTDADQGALIADVPAPEANILFAASTGPSSGH